MNKKFTDNELRAYSKNLFEEKVLRRRLERLREDIHNYNDSSAKHKINIIQENRSIRKTSGGSPTPWMISEDVWNEYEVCVRDRVKRPWAYSVMETTYNSFYREAELPLPKLRDCQRVKSAGTVLITNPPFIDTQKCNRKKDSVQQPSSNKNTKSDSQICKTSLRESVELENTHRLDDYSISSLTAQTNGKHMDSKNLAKFLKEQEFEHNFISSSDNSNDQIEVTTENSLDEARSMKEKSSVMFKENDNETRPFSQVLILPPAYRIDSKPYQDAEWERLRKRSMSRENFTHSASVMVIQNQDENARVRSAELHGKSHYKNQESKDEPNLNKDLPHKDQVAIQGNEKEDIYDNNDINKTVLKTKEIVKFRGHLIKNYIRPEDRYKLDPSILNRRQHRMDRLAKESFTYLKRINHENIKVEIAFPKSARKRLLLKLVEENNSDKKKTFSNTESPLIKNKVERFMISLSDYIEQQRLGRAHTSI